MSDFLNIWLYIVRQVLFVSHPQLTGVPLCRYVSHEDSSDQTGGKSYDYLLTHEIGY